MPLPSFSWQALSTAALVSAQFVALVVWAQNEHSSRVELEHRFNSYTTYVDNSLRDLASADIKRDDRIDRLDNFGTRTEIATGQRLNSFEMRFSDISERLRKFDERLNEIDHRR